MTRQEAEKFIQSIITLRSSAADDLALEAVPIYPAWQAGKSYAIGERIRYEDVLYRVLQAHLSQEDWTPDVAASLFTKVLISDPNTIPEWEQPDSTNPYKKGDKVAHNNSTWVSEVDNNVWEPGVYGWTKV